MLLGANFSDSFTNSYGFFLFVSAKIEGEDFFAKIPWLCQTVASLCTISCVTSLMTIAAMSFNRYIFICVHDKYDRIFKRSTCVCICISFYFVGGVLVLLNVAEIGDHGFDRKSLECIWDRMATFPFTVVFSITLVWIPSIVTGLCYVKIYLYVRKHKKRMRKQNHVGSSILFTRHFHLTRTLFIIYAVFVTCWVPYALLIVIDYTDSFPHEIHVYITMFAHLHPSINWLIYLVTNKKFADAYKYLLNKCKICNLNIIDVASSGVSNNGMGSFQRSKVGDIIQTCHNGTDKFALVSYLTANRLEMHHDENRNLEHKARTNLQMESNC